eukprot:TRINITY_DN2265_c0_g9_i1.p2 TRINITY_DN2265_c0_g9~~TRINITY_DN2265_c0_g9_i1.p2  ORF type:complete len:104 (+),score=5.75 TRINITY_DN2265_c0_g9_i1:25-336(+)
MCIRDSHQIDHRDNTDNEKANGPGQVVEDFLHLPPERAGNIPYDLAPAIIGADLLTGQVLFRQFREVTVEGRADEVRQDHEPVSQHQQDDGAVENPEQPVEAL